ncbi:MAG TPA: CocE/NonD family hydrolase [Steroidobacteraceae bacterium]|nr:CocE/NonD family hydrolase [Steroidobacteraceae bacterium]
MPDGTRLAADLWLPSTRGPDTRLPTVVNFTRYWRARAFEPRQRDSNPAIEAFTAAGYAAVVVDARGSGASFGSRKTELSTCETRDFRFVVDWIARQPWSNGRVASYGVSYSGNTAENAAIDPSPALVAAVAQFTDFDPYASILFPGGLRNAFISGVWGNGVRDLDADQVPQGEWRSGSKSGPRLLGVQPVDEDSDGRQLKLAVSQHSQNRDVTAWLLNAEFREDLGLAAALSDECDQMVAPYRFLRDPDRRRIPTFHWGSWMDAGTAAGVLARFVGAPGDGDYLIGAWSHGAEFDADVLGPDDAPVSPSVEQQFHQVIAFFAPYLKQSTTPGRHQPVLTYYTMGERRWKRTQHWPPAGSATQVWYLSARHSLAREPPKEARAVDTYRVDFSVGTGRHSRWATQIGGPDVFYGDRRVADQRLLTYTGAPLPRDTEITGHPRVTLQVASTHRDGAIIVYLEAVAPDGVVRMITEGELRLIHRRVSSDTPPYPTFGPYHSFKRQDALPMVPNEVAEIDITMLPTSVRVPKGYALRLAIAGHDKDAFHRYPSSGFPTLRVHRSRAHASSLMLPIVEPLPPAEPTS